MKTKLWHVKQKLKTFYFFKLLTVVDCILCYNGDVMCLISTLSLAHKNLLIMICSLCSSGGGGYWLPRMEWHPAGLSVCLPLLIFPCTIKSISSLLAPADPGGPGKRAVKRL